MIPDNPLKIRKKFKPSSSVSRSRKQRIIELQNPELSANVSYTTKDKSRYKNHNYSLGSKKTNLNLPQLLQDQRKISVQYVDQELNNSLDTIETSPQREQIDKLNPYLKDHTLEMKKILANILHININKLDSSKESNYVSAGSKQLNIFRNKQSRIYIKSDKPSEKVLNQKQHMTGTITKKQFFQEILNTGLKFPPEFLFNLVKDIQVENDDQSDDAFLSYSSLRNLIDMYQSLPLRQRKDTNNSDNFKASMDLTAQVQVTKHDRINKLFRHINNRVTEKFKDFRMAFRSMDKDFGGTLDFKEFIQGLEIIGVKFKINDYKMIFEFIDYDQKGTINFYKFCLINTEKKSELEHLKQEHAKLESGKDRGYFQKPPLAPSAAQGIQPIRRNLVFDDGHIPKNKDQNGFNKDVQKPTPNNQFIYFKRQRKTIGLSSYQDLNDQHSFGQKSQKLHNMTAILTNCYTEQPGKYTLDLIKQSLRKKRFELPKNTNAQQVRDRFNKLKYTPLNKSKSNSRINPMAGVQAGSKQYSGTFSIPRKSHIKSQSNLQVINNKIQQDQY